MDFVLLPAPDEPTRRAVAVALVGIGDRSGALHEGYASRWRLAGMADGVASVSGGDEGRAPRTAMGARREAPAA